MKVTASNEPLITSARAKKAFAMWAVATCVVALVVGARMSGGTHFSLHEPLNYVGDSIYYLMATQRLGESAGYFANTRLGFPFGSQLFDIVGSDSGNLLALWALVKASGSAAWANNVYFLAGFPLNALAAFWCLRRLGVSDFTGAVFSFLFAIIPFHFLRITHLYFTWYFVVPIFCWVAVALYEDARDITEKWPIKAVAFAALASFGVYYAFFGCMLILAGSVLGSTRHRSLRPIYAGTFAIACVSLGVALNLLPNLQLISQFGANSETSNRVASGSETYGLKIAQMVLPRPDHHLKALSGLTASYSREFPIVNENMTSTLGLVGVVGFLLLLASAVVYHPRIDDRRRGLLFVLGASTVFLLLSATVGGFSVLFSLLVTPLIRGWNRISVFISFLSFAGLAVAIDGTRSRIEHRRRAAGWTSLALLSIAAFGAWDQTASSDRISVPQAQAEYREDRAFYSTLEDLLPPASAIYQLPYMRFPEAIMKGELSSYDTGKGFLHSRALKWSYGVTAGRPGADFMEDLSRQPISIQMEVARFLGFFGVLVDRRGYPGDKSVDAEIRNYIGGINPTEDTGKNVAFYPLSSLPSIDSSSELSTAALAWVNRWGISKTNGNIKTRSAFDLDFTAPAVLGSQVKSASGLWGAENWGTWSVASKVVLRLRQNLPRHFTLKLVLNAASINVGREVAIRIGSQVSSIVPSAEMKEYVIPFALDTDTDQIEISVPMSVSPAQLGTGPDVRPLGLGFRSLRIIE